ncbi:MAG: hypothetical protein ACYDCC_07490 [Actinomycetota bacterium]
MRKLLLVFLLLAGGTAPAHAAESAVHVVVVTMAGGCGAYPGGTYFPGGCTTARGQTVQFPPLIAPPGASLAFANLDTTDHTVTSGTCDTPPLCNGDGLFDSYHCYGSPVKCDNHVQAHQTLDIDISNLPPGNYPFFCTIHYFTGLLTVEPIP